MSCITVSHLWPREAWVALWSSNSWCTLGSTSIEYINQNIDKIKLKWKHNKFCNVENLRRVHDMGEKFNKSNLWCFVIKLQTYALSQLKTC